MNWIIRGALGAFVGALVGFGIAYLIWTLDGQPARGDVWALVAAALWGLATFAGALIGALNAKDV